MHDERVRNGFWTHNPRGGRKPSAQGHAHASRGCCLAFQRGPNATQFGQGEQGKGPRGHTGLRAKSSCPGCRCGHDVHSPPHSADTGLEVSVGPRGAGEGRRGDAPCLTKVWLVSSRISQPSIIMRSMARFFRMFSVSLTSSCIILRGQERSQRQEEAMTRPLGGPGRKARPPGFSELAVPKGQRACVCQAPTVSRTLNRHDLILLFWKPKEVNVLISEKRKRRLTIRKQVCLI